jgi:hypothetical protein
MTLRTVGIIAGCLAVAFGTGWCTGASGRTGISTQLSETQIRADLSETRAAVLGARLNLSESNFGDAQRALQYATTVAERLQGRLRATGQSDRVGAVQAVITTLGEAGQRSSALDATASDLAAEALRALEGAVPVPPQ